MALYANYPDAHIARDIRTLELTLTRPRLSPFHRELAQVQMAAAYAMLDSRWPALRQGPPMPDESSRCTSCGHFPGCECFCCPGYGSED